MSESEEISGVLSETMLNAFDWVKADREKFYRLNPDKKPDINDIDRLISDASNKNALISGGAGLIPGPLGMAVAIPEIALIIKYQLRLIYDIGVAYGKDEKVMTRELLAGIFAYSAGSMGIGLLTMHGGKYLIKRVSLRVMQKVVHILAGKVTQQVLKSMISKWIPVIGALAMATWSKYQTNKIGQTAKRILAKEIELVDDI